MLAIKLGTLFGGLVAAWVIIERWLKGEKIGTEYIPLLIVLVILAAIIVVGMVVGMINKKAHSKQLKPYGVFVEMERPDVLADENEIKKALISGMKTGFYLSPSTENGHAVNSTAPYVRRFALIEQENLEPFTRFMKTIDGVIGVKKGGDSFWKAERRVEKEIERKRQK